MAFGQEIKDFIDAFKTGSDAVDKSQQRDIQQQSVTFQGQKIDQDRQMLDANLAYYKARTDAINAKPTGGAPSSYDQSAQQAGEAGRAGYFDPNSPQAQQIKQASVVVGKQLGIDPVDLVTAMSYETGGTLNPWQPGPPDKNGVPRRGLIQMGTGERAQYGYSQDQTPYDQVMAVGRYLKDRGVQPGMGMADIYSTINAGSPGHYNASDAATGGAPGTVLDKVRFQMAGHRANALALLQPSGAVAVAPTDQYTQQQPQSPTTAIPVADPGATPAYDDSLDAPQ